MTMQNDRLTEPAYVNGSGTAAAVYTHNGSGKTHVRGWMLHNRNSSTETVKGHLVPDSGGSAGTASDANCIMEISLAPKETQLWEIPYGYVMKDTNETIQMSTTTASKVVVVVLGDKDI